MKVVFTKIIAYAFLFLVFIFPIFLFSYFVQLRLFLIIPIILYIILFYNGIVINENNQIVEFEIEEKTKWEHHTRKIVLCRYLKESRRENNLAEDPVLMDDK